MAEPRRGVWLTICAICFGLLAISNVLKPLHLGGQTFVFFGTPLEGMKNAIIGPFFGAFLAVYAYGVWTMRRFAMAMGHAYATYVIINMTLWRLDDPDTSLPHVLGGLAWAAAGIGVALSAAVILTRRKDELR
jgi:hypothetical protein